MTVWSYSQKMIEKEGCSSCRRLLDRMKCEKTLFNRKMKVVEIMKEFVSDKHEFFLEAKKMELADFKMKCQREKDEVRQHLLNTIEKCEVYCAERNENKMRLNKALKDVANYKFISDQSFAKAKDLEVENARLRSQLNLTTSNKKKGKKRKKGMDSDLGWLETLSIREPLGSPDEGLELSDGLSSVGSPYLEPSYDIAKLPSRLSHCEECIKVIMDRHICGKGSEEAEVAPLFITPSSQPLRASTPLKELSTSVEDYADENHPESPKSAKKRRRREKNKPEIAKNDIILKEKTEDPKLTVPLKKIQSTISSPNYESVICDENVEPAAVQNKKQSIHSSKNNRTINSGTITVESEETENSTQIGANTAIIDMPSIFEDFDTLIDKKLLETSTSLVNSDDFNFDSLEDSIIINKNERESSQQIGKLLTPKGVDEVSSQVSTNKPENEFNSLWEESNDVCDKLANLSNILDVLNNKNDLFLDGELGDLPEKSSLPDLNENPVKNKRISRVVKQNKNLDSGSELTDDNSLSISEQEDIIGADLDLSSDDDSEYPDKVIEEKINETIKPPSFTEPCTKISIFDIDGETLPDVNSREMSPVFFEKNNLKQEISTNSSSRQLLTPNILDLVKEEIEHFELVSPLKSVEKLNLSNDDYLMKTVPCGDIITKNLAKNDTSIEDLKEENSESFDNYLDEMPLTLRLNMDALPMSLWLELSNSEKEVQWFNEAGETIEGEKINHSFEEAQTLIKESEKIGKEFDCLKSNKISSKHKGDMRNLHRSKSKKHCKTLIMKKAGFVTPLTKNNSLPPIIELAENLVNEDLMLLDLKPDKDIKTPPKNPDGSDCNDTFADLEDKKHIKISSKDPSVCDIPENILLKSEPGITKETNSDDKLNNILEEMLHMPSLLSPLSQDVNHENNSSSSSLSKQRSSEPEILVKKRLVDYSSDSSDSESCLSHSTVSNNIELTSDHNTDLKIKKDVIVDKQAKKGKFSPIKSWFKDKLSPIKDILSPSKDTPANIISTYGTKEKIIRDAPPEFKSPKCLAPKLKKSKKRASSIEFVSQLKKRENKADLTTPKSPSSPHKQTPGDLFDTDEDFLQFVDGLKQNYEALSPLAGDIIESNANSSLEKRAILEDKSNLCMDSVQEESSCIRNILPDSNTTNNKMEGTVQDAVSKPTKHLSTIEDSEEINYVTHKESDNYVALCDEVSLVETEVPKTNEDDTQSLLDRSNEFKKMNVEGSNDGHFVCLTPSNDEENLDAFDLKTSTQVDAKTILNSENNTNQEDRGLLMDHDNTSDGTNGNVKNILCDNTIGSEIDELMMDSPLSPSPLIIDELVTESETVYKRCMNNTTFIINQETDKFHDISLLETQKSKELKIDEHISEMSEEVVGSSLATSDLSYVEHSGSLLSSDLQNNSEELKNKNDQHMTIPLFIDGEKELINESVYNNQTTEAYGIIQCLEETKDLISLPDNECLELTKSENQKYYSKKKKKSEKEPINFKLETSSFSRLRQFQLCKKLKQSQNISIYFEDVCLSSTMEDVMYLSSRNLFDTKENQDVENILKSLKNTSNSIDDVNVCLFEDVDFYSQGEGNMVEESLWKHNTCFDDSTTNDSNSPLNDTIESYNFDISENSSTGSCSSIMEICNNGDNSFVGENPIIYKDKTSLPLTNPISATNGNVEMKKVKMLSSSLPRNIYNLIPAPLSGSINNEDCLFKHLVIDESPFNDHKKHKSDEVLSDTSSAMKIRKEDYSANDQRSIILDSKPLYLKSDTKILNTHNDPCESFDKICSDGYKEVGSGINMLASHKNMNCFGKLVSLQYSGISKRVSNFYSGLENLRANNYISFSNNINNTQSSNNTDQIEDALEELNTTDDHVEEDFENQSPRKQMKIEAGDCKNNTCVSNPAVSISNENSVLEEKNNETFEAPKHLKFNFYTEASETEMQSEPCLNTIISDNNVIQKEEGILNEEPSKLKFPETWNIRPQGKSPRLEGDMILCKTSAFECSLDYWHDYARLNPKPKPVNLITEKDLQLLENCIKEIMKANNEDNLLEKIQAISLKIEHMDSGHIADMIVDAVFTDNGEADLRFTPPAPPLTPVQRRLLLLVSFLAKGREEYYITVLKACEEPVVSFVDKCSVDKLCNLVQFHTAMCKHLGLLSRSRAFLYDILYCKGQKVYPLVYSMLPLWIEILPSSQESQDCLLTQAIVYLLTHYVANQKQDTVPYHNSLKQFLDDAYEYGKPVVTRDTLCNKLIDNIRVPGAGLALVLLCKREEWDWASKTMESKLHPIILSWIQDQVDEDTAIQAVLCLGRVVRGYPINVASNSIKRSRDLLEAVLKHQKNIDVTEAAVNSICMLRRHDLFSCSVIFTKWRPAEGKITKNMADNIKTVLSAKQLPYWKKFLSRYN